MKQLNILLIFLTLCLSAHNTSTGNSTPNLLPGDADVEIEADSMTSGAYSNSNRGDPRWKYDRTTGFLSAGSIRIFRVGTGIGIKPLKLKPGKYTFSFYAKADEPGNTAYIAANTLTCGWPAVLERRAKNAHALTSEWKRFSYTFEADGKSLYSCYYGNAKPGANFDRFMLNAGEKPLPWVPSSKQMLQLVLPLGTGYVYPFGKVIPLELKLICHTAERPTGKLQLAVSDHTGKVVLRQEFTPEYDSKGAFVRKIRLDLGRSGWFRIDVNQQDSELKAFAAFSAVRPPEPAIPQIEPFTGLCGAAQQIEAAKLLGVKWLQYYLAWYTLEPAPRRYELDSLKKLREYKKQGFRIQALVTTGPPPWALPENMRKDLKKLGVEPFRCIALPETQDQYYRPLIRKVMQDYPDVFDIYELGGELDALLGLNVYYKSRDNKNLVGPFVLGESFEQGCRMMSIAAEEILKADPRARISSVRPSDVDARYAYIYSREMFRKLGKYMTCFGIDCYPQPRWIGPGQPPTGTEQDLATRLRDARAAMKGLVKSEDVMISEYGYFIDHNRIFDPEYMEKHINRIARSFLKARLIGMKSLHYYTASSSSLEGKRYYMGIWHYGTPMAATAALSSAARIVENVTECSEIPINKKMTAGVFRKFDGRAAASLWSIDGKYRPQLELPDDKFIITDVMGNPMPELKRNGKLVFQLGPLPCYIWRTEKGQDNYRKLKTALEQLKILEEVPVDIVLRMAAKGKLKAYLTNNSARNDFSGSAEIAIPGKPRTKVQFKVDRNSRKTVCLPLPEPGCSLDITFHFKGYKPFPMHWQTPELIQVRKISPSKLDQTLNPWKNLKPVRIEGRDHIHPVDHTTYSGPDDLSADLRFAHDGQNLYLAAEVTDDLHFNRYPISNLWRGDCMQIGFDPEMNFVRNENGLDADDSFLTCGLLSGEAALSVHRGPHRFELQKQTEYRIIRDEAGKRTLYLLKFPLAAIDGNLKTGSIFGFNCVFMDDDTNSGSDYWLFLRQGLAGGLRPDKFAPCILE